MGILNRPYAGTWTLNPNSVVRMTPDCLVYINGRLDIPGCPTCGGSIDIQQYITAVTVDPSTQPIATATITMQIPRSSSHAIIRDGQFILKTGMEVHIYFRGYFPVKGLYADMPPEEEIPGLDMTNAVVYPYYHVFHGVVVEATYEYSGGEHTASLSCSDILHFWQNQLQATKGSVFGARPEQSGVRANLNNHTFAGMTPYAIIYNLYRDVAGAAGSVGFAMGAETNVSARSSATDNYMWSFMGLYWEKRFSEHFNDLRMFGVDGSLFNAYQQSLLGRLSTKSSRALSYKFADPDLKGADLNIFRGLQAAARAVGYDPVAIYAGAASESNAKNGGLGINLTDMQAFVSDIGSWGQPNLFETDYQTKLEIATTVCEMTGFEFYQDVDGDFVFKPPFYNLDTSGSRAYVIEDIDIISISFSTGEPGATAVKATAGSFQNLTGTGCEGEWGRRAVYADYRLVAQYGWMEHSFETAYASDTRAMYFMCINRLDLFNVGMKKATIQIPLRPELRPGYPVYVRYLDCFFYLQSFSHSFTFGGQCTTSLNCVGRRAKFFAPGQPPSTGANPTVADIQLDNPWLPPLPLEVIGSDSVPRYQGFPNVVLGIDPELLNPGLFTVGMGIKDLASESQVRALIRQALALGVLELDPESTATTDKEQRFTGPFLLRKSETETISVTASDIQDQASAYSTAHAALAKAMFENSNPNKKASKPPHTAEEMARLKAAEEQALSQASALQQIVDMVRNMQGTAIENGDEVANYFSLVEDLKARFVPGNTANGYFRYYSSSHPEAEQQGSKSIVSDAATTGTTQAGGLIYLEKPDIVAGFINVSGENYFEPEAVTVKAGLPLVRPAVKNTAVPTATHQIGAVAIARYETTVNIMVPKQSGNKNLSFPASLLQEPMEKGFNLTAIAETQGATVAQRFEDQYNEYVTTINEYVTVSLPAFSDAIGKIKKKGAPLTPTDQLEDSTGKEITSVQAVSVSLAKTLAMATAPAFVALYNANIQTYGPPGNNSLSTVSPEENAAVYRALTQSWMDLVVALAGEDATVGLGTDNTNLVIAVPDTNTAPMFSPVFPVSDERGYEVIGSYRYGRGMNIDAGGNFQKLMETTPFEKGVDINTIDDFVVSLTLASGQPSEALGMLSTFNPNEAAALERATSQYIEFAGLPSNSSFDSAFMNWVASSKEYCQKVHLTNAAYTLSDITTDPNRQGKVCSCKGAEADVLLIAFADQNLVSIDQPDEVSAWVADQTLISGQSWSTAQAALRGQAMNTSYAEAADAFAKLTDLKR